jgi:hypothetical protein
LRDFRLQILTLIHERTQEKQGMSDSDMTQQKGAMRRNLWPSWPEVTGFGAGPNKQDFSRRKPQKNRQCQYTDTACRLVA